jgi:hypothetical protein
MSERDRDQRQPAQIGEQEARELRELDEAREARRRLQAFYEEAQRRHPQPDQSSAADVVNEERGVRT